VQSNSTDASCPGARRFPFAKGYAPPYQACVYAEPEALPEADQGGGWRSWFGLDRKAPQDPARELPEQSASPPPPQEQR
jgi:penicillin-binding protein 1B